MACIANNTEGVSLAQRVLFHTFPFTGKERDEETGFGYFGARYMDYELMTMWLSVDPMADKYPGISPYAYCAWNPVRLVDPDGKESMENYDGWKVDRQNKTITRVSINGGDFIQYVEGAGTPIRYNTSQSDLLNVYKDYKVIDNVSGCSELNPAEENAKSDGVSPNAIAGFFVGGTAFGCNKMSKAMFDYDNGTYMGKDGSIKIMHKGKNGGLKGRYKPQMASSARYLNAGRFLTVVGAFMAIESMDDTEVQYRNGMISQRERWTNHAIDVIECTPVGCLAPLAYELGGKYGPSTWINN